LAALKLEELNQVSSSFDGPLRKIPKTDFYKRFINSFLTKIVEKTYSQAVVENKHSSTFSH